MGVPFRRALIAAALSALSAGAAAQDVPASVPSTVEPGRPQPVPPPLPRAPIALEWTLELPPGSRPPPGTAEEPLAFADLRLEGVRAFDPADLADIYADRRGEEITFGEFYGFANAIERRYQEAGYLLSFAYVPPQTVEDGVFTVRVVEGYVARIVVDGAEGRLKRTLERILAPVAEDRPLRQSTLERQLLLANDLAGIEATGVLQPAEGEPGASELLVTVARDPVDLRVSVDNRGADFAGPWRFTGLAGANSALGLGERLSAFATVAADPEELIAGGLDLSLPIGGRGWRANLSASYSEAEPGEELSDLEILTESVGWSAGASYPVVRSRAENLTLAADFAWLDTEVQALGDEFSRDRLRSLSVSALYDRTGFLDGAGSVRLEFVQGLPILAATDPDSDPVSRADAEPDYRKLTVDAVRAQRLYGPLVLLGTAGGQFAFDPLPAAEEFAVGGSIYGRAFDAGEITGDHGVAGSLELQLPFSPDIDRIGTVTPYGFVDIGWVRDRDSDVSRGLGDRLSSGGFGVRAELFGRVDAGLEYARPIDEPDTVDDDFGDRVFFTLTARF
jgi:hemolysin activation/secretion protein